MSLIFISYRREDSAGYAGRLHESLERRFGADEVFRDVDTLEPGQDFVDAIATRLRDCRACLVLIGQEWLDAADASGARRLDQENDYVRLEIGAALARPDVLVVPVLVEGTAMPSENQLPAAIRALSRRQAVSLRDEVWDVDVDRLVRTLRKSIGTNGGSPRSIPGSQSLTPGVRPGARPNLRWAVLGLTVLALLLMVRAFQDGNDEPSSTTTTTVASLDGPSAVTPAQAIAIPRVAEIANGNLIYTLLSGGVTPRGSDTIVRLRFRLSNEGPYPANFWDGSFRLAVRGQVLEPTSGLNELVSGHAIRQGIVSFEVPSETTEAGLRVLVGNQAAELPLVLKSTGTPSQVENIDTGDALSRAIVAGLVRDPRPLVSGKEASYMLAAVTARRFVNAIRILANVRMTNHGRYPAAFSTNAVRLLADGQATAPFEGPSEVVQPDATTTADFVFDVAPSVQRLVLRVTGESVAEVPLTLPDAVR